MPSAEQIMMIAIPTFFVLMAVELLASRLMRRRVYRLNDAINSIGLGTFSQIVGVFTKLLTIGVYAWVVEHVALFALPADSVWVWVSGLLLYDFCYYWLHRCGHEVGVLWAAHAVHHQSERYNLATALRQTSSGFLLGWLFYLPMALAGVPPLVFVVVGLVDLLYQFWVHTQLVGRLGWADRVFVTPSNHRVHHGQNAYCIDRNYGGILILWDRLFGTFADERPGEPIVYGIRGALRSWDPLWANAHGYATIARTMAAAPCWRDALRVPFMPPGWRPPGVAVPPPVDLAAFRPYAPPLSAPLAAAALLQLAVLVAFALHFLVVAPTAGLALAGAYALAIVLQLTALAVLNTRGLAAWPMEAARWCLGALLLAASPLHGPAWWALWVAAGMVTAAALWRSAGATRPVPASR